MVTIDRKIEVGSTLGAMVLACVACVQSCALQKQSFEQAKLLQEKASKLQEEQAQVQLFSENRERASLSNPSARVAYLICLDSAIALADNFAKPQFLRMMPVYDKTYLDVVFYDDTPSLKKIVQRVPPPTIRVMDVGSYFVSGGVYRKATDETLRDRVFTIRRRLDQHDETRSIEVVIKKNQAGRNVILIGGKMSKERAELLSDDMRQFRIAPEAEIVEVEDAGLN